MAKSARGYVFDGMELLPEALAPFVERRLEGKFQNKWRDMVKQRLHRVRMNKAGNPDWDQPLLLNTMDLFWDDAFRGDFDRADRGLVNELIVVRNKLSHNERFTYSDAERALDSMRRLTMAAGAEDTAVALGKMRDTILRVQFAEVARGQERRKLKSGGIAVEAAGGLLPWRKVVEPHQDVATGNFSQAEFAADLSKVHNGSAPDEYRNAREFFSRTYLTEGLSNLLVGAARRLSGKDGDPVVELQTNFGGGKTHSMLALYHMVGDIDASDLQGLDQLMTEHDLNIPSRIRRAVIVGTSRGPGDIVGVAESRSIRTTWGELAWQIGGNEAFDMLADCNNNGVAPGSNLLEEMLRKYSPSLILIDEWVAYLRQIDENRNLPSGSFESNLTFVQSLTEAVKATPGVLLVASLPESEVEAGGEVGKEAMVRLKRTFGRVESSWRPASQEESYEIVRRRLFREIPSEKYHHRDNTLRQFAKLYRDNASDFPPQCTDSDYRRKMESAYPVHPELFDQLYLSWGSLEGFQRTRGVLRLMAQLIHELWMNDDPSVAIMPGSVLLGSEKVGPELVRYADENWISIIAGDVDGVSSKPYEIDRLAPNLKRYSASLRVARTIFVATAPTHGQGNNGIDDKQINLGVVQPGERPAIFGDALRRLSNRATFIHSDIGKYWYSTSANLNRLASELADQYPDSDVSRELNMRVSKYFGNLERGQFGGVHFMSGDTSDVPDESGEVRMVILDSSKPHDTQSDSAAEGAAREVMNSCGGKPRVYCNTLVFLAADRRRVDDLVGALRDEMAWSKIVQDTKRLDLTQSNSALANKKYLEAKDTLIERLREAWCHLIYPTQVDAESVVEWVSTKIATQTDTLISANDRLAKEQGIWPEIGPDNLNRQLEKYMWNDKSHIKLIELYEYFSCYIYLPRITCKAVLKKAVYAAVCADCSGPFAYAQRWNDEKKEYVGLVVCGALDAQVIVDSDSVVVKLDIAEDHIKKQAKELEEKTPEEHSTSSDSTADKADSSLNQDNVKTRFQGTVIISSDRPIRDFGNITESVIEQLTTLRDADVSIKVEIYAEIPSGIDQSKERTLLENSENLNFIDKSVS